jgi:crotonobetainyl-CoA:carnitine CoA-transferase CaiB-like acyl-CoA transferase
MGALDGVRVIDVGVLVQAPQCALLLRDLGAEVVKVELPGFGDQSRWLPVEIGDPRSAYFSACNRGKRSMTLDLRQVAGKEAFLRLVARSDVLVSNFKPGTLDGWGLGYEVLSEVNPGLIVAAGSAFGHRGPDAHREGADLSAQALGGLISTTGRDGEAPTPVAVTICDHIASQNLVAGILAALIARGRTGRGQRVEVSLLGSQIWAQASEYTAYLLTGTVPGRANGGHPLIAGLYGIFPTLDGWIAIVGVAGANRPVFYDVVGRPELFEDPRFNAPLLTHENKAALFAELSVTFATRPTSEWAGLLGAAGLRYAPVRDYADAAADPQVWANEHLVRVPGADGRETTVVASPIWMSDTPTTTATVAPELGQHTEEILLELGYPCPKSPPASDHGSRGTGVGNSPENPGVEDPSGGAG